MCALPYIVFRPLVKDLERRGFTARAAFDHLREERLGLDADCLRRALAMHSARLPLQVQQRDFAQAWWLARPNADGVVELYNFERIVMRAQPRAQ